MQPDFKSLFSAGVMGIGFILLPPCSSRAGALDPNLSKDLSRSAFSTTSIVSDLANISKQVRAAEVNPVSAGSALTSLRPGTFEYDAGTPQTIGVRKVSEAIRATQELEHQQSMEIANHAFWYAKFWTHSPLALAAFLLGGDHHALETPSSQFEKLGASDYGNDAEIRKFEGTFSFGDLSQGASK
jgi:hypothetical protein